MGNPNSIIEHSFGQISHPLVSTVEQPVYDVIVVGGGPVGMISACLMSAFHKDLRICVLDKRREPTRHHGLHIASTTAKKIEKIIKAVNEDHLVNRGAILDFISVFNSWSSEVVRISSIEKMFEERAKNLGITILRGTEYEVTEPIVDALFDEKDKKIENGVILSGQQQRIQELFRGARVVIGADGAHSVIKKRIMGEQYSDQKMLQYLVELKFNSPHNTPKRNPLRGSWHASHTAAVDLETIGGRSTNQEANKPVALQLIINKETFEHLRKEIKNSDHTVVKGTFAHPWTLQELEQVAVTDPVIRAMLVKLNFYIAELYSRGGQCIDEKITALPLGIYCSETTAKVHKGKIVVLSGDANSGLIWRRGFNKSLQEAALCAAAITKYFKRLAQNPQSQVSITVLPSEFIVYQRTAQRLFQVEKKKILAQNVGIQSLQRSLDTSVTPLVRGITRISSYIFSYLRSFGAKLHMK